MAYGFVLENIRGLSEDIQPIDCNITGDVSFSGKLQYDSSFRCWKDDSDNIELAIIGKTPDPSTTTVLYDQSATFTDGAANIPISEFSREWTVSINGISLSYDARDGQYLGSDDNYSYVVSFDDRHNVVRASMYTTDSYEGVNGNYQVIISEAGDYILKCQLINYNLTEDDVGKTANINLSFSNVTPEFENAVKTVMSSNGTPMNVRLTLEDGEYIANKTYAEILDALSNGQVVIAQTDNESMFLSRTYNNSNLVITGSFLDPLQSNAQAVWMNTYEIEENNHINVYRLDITSAT